MPFCEKCGASNGDGHFCESCGAVLADRPPRTAPEAQRAVAYSSRRSGEGLAFGHRVSASGAALALLLFLLPWIEVSCGGLTAASFSGWTIATKMDSAYFFVPIGAAAVLICVYLLSVGLIEINSATKELSFASLSELME